VTHDPTHHCASLSADGPDLTRHVQKTPGADDSFICSGFNFLGKFHKLIQMIASHHTLDGDASERLMLKYYEYLHRMPDPALAVRREPKART
jgi:hypothetical protein